MKLYKLILNIQKLLRHRHNDEYQYRHKQPFEKLDVILKCLIRHH
jgi:hypothetical protein